MSLLGKPGISSSVCLDIDVTSKKRLFEQIGLVLENEKQLGRAATFDALFAREKLGSTGLGYGVAIPHGRIKGLRDTHTVFIRSREGVPFDAPDGLPVRLVFAMLVPEHATEQHLNLLSELAQMFSDAAFRDALMSASDEQQVRKLFLDWSPYPQHVPPQRTATL